MTGRKIQIGQKNWIFFSFILECFSNYSNEEKCVYN